MALQKGRDMLIYDGPAAGIGTNTLIGGLTSTTLSMGNQIIDGSTKDTDGWRELVEDAAIKSFSLACSGFFKDSTTDALVLSRAMNGSIDTYTLRFPNDATLECSFLISGYTRGGEVQGVETYSYTLESHGQPTYTA